MVMPIHRLTLAANMKDYKGRNTYSYHYSTKELSDLSDGIRSLVSKQHYIMDYTNKLSFALKQIEVLRKERLEFFRNMQHMLRTPIGHIIGASDIIMTQHKSEISDVTQDYISMINNAATELLSSVNTMFTSADIEAGNIELNQMDCNVRKVVEDVIHDVSPRMKEAQLSLEVNIKKIPKVNIDPIWFGAAIFNIIDNSIKFSNSGGSIKIAIRRVNAGISLVIEDNGIGMSAHQIFNIQKVLENPLSKNNIAETNDGIGLGLTIAHHILELHNISLSIESTEGVGTKVTIIIPNIKIKRWLKMFEGAITASITPFKNSRLDINSMQNHIVWQYEQGIKSIVISGCTGESSSLTHDERNILAEVSVEVARKYQDLKIILGIVSSSTEEAILLSQKQR